MTYNETDHSTWATLLDGYRERLYKYGCKEFIRGFDRLEFGERVEGISELSDRVYALCGWRLRPVTGLITGHAFLEMLSEKVHPMVVHMRKPQELDFASLPDLFHDALGHLPLLMLPSYGSFLQKYSEVGSKLLDSPRAVRYLARLYWYTIETGLIMEEGSEMIFGAAILTSRAECENARSTDTPKFPLNLDTVLSTNYDSFKLQPLYFVIESFDSLLSMADDLDARIRHRLDWTSVPASRRNNS